MLFVLPFYEKTFGKSAFGWGTTKLILKIYFPFFDFPIEKYIYFEPQSTLL